MCGIIGYTGTQNAVPKLFEGLYALEYRGYDSAGISYFKDSRICTVKTAGRIYDLEKKIEDDLRTFCGIGHTRWATHGEPSDKNAHPHTAKNLSLVHNGIIENYAELKEFLSEKGYDFLSETDSEVAAKLIDYFYRGDPIEAIKCASAKFTGAYACGVIFADFPGVIYAFSENQPLIAAVSDNGNFIASDISAVLGSTKKYFKLTKGEIAAVKSDSICVTDSNGHTVQKELEKACWSVEQVQKGNFAHFMLKEIHEEPEAVIKTLKPRTVGDLPDFSKDGLSDEILEKTKHIYIVACGTAMHAGLAAKIAFERFTRIKTDVEIASEFRYASPIFSENDLVIVISQSGETADTLAALRLAKSAGVFTIAVVNVPGSAISREADCVLYTHSGPEISVASTKAYTVQTALLYLFALKLALSHRKLTESEASPLCRELLTKAPKSIQTVLDNSKTYRDIANKYKSNNDIFFIGRGADYCICAEASLKMKEISYIHCESYPAGEMKHGTISLISDGTPVFAFITSKNLLEKTINNIKEVRARGAKVIAIYADGLDIPPDAADDLLPVPRISELFMPMVSATVSQLIAYYTALELGHDVDKPRNLAKSVTVE